MSVCERADRAQYRIRFGKPPGAHERHAEIEARVGHPVGRPLPVIQQFDRLIKATLAQQDVGEQMLLLGIECRSGSGSWTWRIACSARSR